MNLREKIQVRDKYGELLTFDEYQKKEDLLGNQIGDYFSFMEPRFLQDIQDYGYLEVNEPLMILLDTYREHIDKPVTINSFNRSEKKQQELRNNGFKAATFSPHVVKMAADIDTYTETETRESAEILLKLSKKLHIPCRVGYKAYLDRGQTFIHLDVCPLYYASKGEWNHKPHPKAWEIDGLTW